MMQHNNARQFVQHQNATPKSGRWTELNKNNQKWIIKYKQIYTYSLQLTYQNRKVGLNNANQIVISDSPPTTPLKPGNKL